MKWRANQILSVILLLSGVGAARAADPVDAQPSTILATQPFDGPITAPQTQPAHAPDGFLSEAQLTEAFRAGKFVEVLRETTRIRNAPPVLAHYNDFNLRLLRAESYLQMKNAKFAADNFMQASLIAPDKDKQALMQATALLIQRSNGFKYLARNTDEDGNPWLHPGERHPDVRINLLVLSKRSAALRALHADQWFLTTAAVEQAKNAVDMAGFHNALQDLAELAVVERAMTGGEEETQKLRQKTGMEIDAMIRGALAGMTNTADALQTAAKTTVTAPLPMNGISGATGHATGSDTGQRLRGLYSDEAATLGQIKATAADVGHETEGLAAKLHLDQAVFQKSVNDAAALEKLVSDVLASNLVYERNTLSR